jgi:CheY-like chemotaxis protein
MTERFDGGLHMNILICDDIEAEARQLDDLLRASGFPVHTSVSLSGYDALRYVNTGALIDVCFLDFLGRTMPVFR